ncbi:Site-specific recombinase XerD [Streptomyces venezuelae]|nr:Site-specific recombinase XerD [Streptomyces venezuelae]
MAALVLPAEGHPVVPVPHLACVSSARPRSRFHRRGLGPRRCPRGVPFILGAGGRYDFELNRFVRELPS